MNFTTGMGHVGPAAKTSMLAVSKVSESEKYTSRIVMLMLFVDEDKDKDREEDKDKDREEDKDRMRIRMRMVRMMMMMMMMKPICLVHSIFRESLIHKPEAGPV